MLWGGWVFTFPFNSEGFPSTRGVRNRWRLHRVCSFSPHAEPLPADGRRTHPALAEARAVPAPRVLTWSPRCRAGR